jgi:hypothetical protein
MANVLIVDDDEDGCRPLGCWKWSGTPFFVHDGLAALHCSTPSAPT